MTGITISQHRDYVNNTLRAAQPEQVGGGGAYQVGGFAVSGRCSRPIITAPGARRFRLARGGLGFSRTAGWSWEEVGE